MTILQNSEEIATFCKALHNEDFITIDTEFLREKTYYPKLCLVQISGPDKDARAIDPLMKNIDLSPLYALLEDKNVLKVFHAGRQDLEIFFNLTGKVVTPIFDTQIAAMVCGYGDSIGYDKLVRGITNAQIDKSSQFTDWSIRPLSEKQLYYALGDVTHLCDIYLHLKKELEKRGRTEWVAQEKEVLNSPATYENDPYKTWERIKMRSPKAKSLMILKEVAAWREQTAQKRNVPKNWVMRDDALSDLAGQAPTDKHKLAKIRNISKDMAEGKIGAQLLEVVNKALNTPKDQWPSPKKRVVLSSEAMVIIDILKMLLKVQSAHHEVASKIIASAADIEAIALDDNADVPALKGWRREIFGADAIAVKHGKMAIGLKNGVVTKFNL